MKFYSFLDEPVKVFGIVDFEKKKKFQRLPDELIEKIPRLGGLGIRTPGVRVAVRTNSAHITVRMKLTSVNPDQGIPIFGSHSAYVFSGDRQTSTYLGIIAPGGYGITEFEATYTKENVMEDVTVWLPRNPVISSVEIGVDDDAEVEAPTPYKYPKPVLFYGSSITEGGCPSVGFNAYTSLLSRKLDCDFYNFGFSANAKGDLNMAEYIASLDISVLVMDYDYNAPSAAFLKETHEPFFKYIRERRPDLPVVFLSRPAIVCSKDDIARRDIVYETYKHAKDAGDENVWFVDGIEMFPDEDRQLCSVDTCHPNDHGFHLMAQKIAPVLGEALKKTV